MDVLDYIQKCRKMPQITFDEKVEGLKLATASSTGKATFEDFEDFIATFECQLKDYSKDPFPNTAIHGPQGKRGINTEGIKFDSIWEFAFYKYHRDICGAVVERNRFDSIPYTNEAGKPCKFYYDFLVNGQKFEVKGIWRPSDLCKRDQCPDVTFVDSNEMKPIIKELYRRYPNWKQEYQQV